MKRIILILSLILILSVGLFCVGCDASSFQFDGCASEEQEIPQKKTETETEIESVESTFKLTLSKINSFYLPVLSGVVKSDFSPEKLLLVIDNETYDITSMITRKKFIESDEAYQTYFTGNLIEMIDEFEKKDYEITIKAVRGTKQVDSGYEYVFRCDATYHTQQVLDESSNEYILVLDKVSN